MKRTTKNRQAGDARLRHFNSLIDARNVAAAQLDSTAEAVRKARSEFYTATQKLLRAATRLQKAFPHEPKFTNVMLRCMLDLRSESEQR